MIMLVSLRANTQGVSLYSNVLDFISMSFHLYSSLPRAFTSRRYIPYPLNTYTNEPAQQLLIDFNGLVRLGSIVQVSSVRFRENTSSVPFFPPPDKKIDWVLYKAIALLPHGYSEGHFGSMLTWMREGSRKLVILCTLVSLPCIGA